MDLSAFSNENFDAKEWINSTFSSQEAQLDKESFASTSVLKLQSFIQEVNNALEETAQLVIQNLPKVARELEAMKQEAVFLQEHMQVIKEDVVKVERESANSMKSLLQIEAIKSRMQDATKALQEADNWTTLDANVEEVFEKGDINEIASKLVGMQNSLEILVDVPDYQDRCQRLENLKNRLEALLSPHLITAFNAPSLDVSQMYVYVRIFKDIRRLPELLKYYHKWQKSSLLRQWRETVEADPEEIFPDWLNSFYDTLLSTWHIQSNWCGQVFSDSCPVSILADLFVDILTSLEPGFPFCMDAALKQQTNHLTFVIEVKQITDRFARNLEAGIQAAGPGAMQSVHVTSLAQTLYSMHRQHVENYATLQERSLLRQLESPNTASTEITDSVLLLGDSVAKIFNFLCEAESQCQQLTHGCGYPGLLCAIEATYKAYTQQFQNVARQIRQSNSNRSPGEEWSLFQQALHTLQITGDVLLQIEGLSSVLIGNAREAIRRLGNTAPTIDDDHPKTSFPSPFHCYDDLLLTAAKKREFREFARRLQSGRDFPHLDSAAKAFQKLCREVGKLTYDLVLQQIHFHLKDLPSMKVWSAEQSAGSLTPDLPSFGITPQEYITLIGQYLMTLPQHVEPFVLHDNPSLVRAMKYAQLPFSSEQEADSDQVADFLLGCIARGTAEACIQAVLAIPSLTAASKAQLVTDLGYMVDILDDLGLTVPQSLQDLIAQLKSSAESKTASARI